MSARFRRTGLLPAQRTEVVDALRRFLREIAPVSINYDFHSPEYQAARTISEAAHKLGGLLSGDSEILMPAPFRSSGNTRRET